MIAAIVAAAMKIFSQLLDLHAKNQLTQEHLDAVVAATAEALHQVPPPKEACP